jgi:hypothetical protein
MRFHSVIIGFIVAVALHPYLPHSVDPGLHLAIVQLLAMYLHKTLTSPVEIVLL